MGHHDAVLILIAGVRLAAGIARGQAEGKAGPIEKLAIQAGDQLSLVIGPRDGNHSFDLTELELVISATDGDQP